MQRSREVATSETIWWSNMMARYLFENLDSFDLLSLKFHTLDHIVKGVSQFAALNFIIASVHTACTAW